MIVGPVCDGVSFKAGFSTLVGTPGCNACPEVLFGAVTGDGTGALDAAGEVAGERTVPDGAGCATGGV